MKKILHHLAIAILLLIAINSCVSLKKYKLLEADYQNCGASQKGLEQENRSLKVDLEELKHQQKQK